MDCTRKCSMHASCQMLREQNRYSKQKYFQVIQPAHLQWISTAFRTGAFDAAARRVRTPRRDQELIPAPAAQSMYVRRFSLSRAWFRSP